MRFLPYLLLIILAGIVVLLLFGAMIGRQRSKKAERLLQTLDTKYDSFIRKQMAIDLIEDQGAENMERLLEQVVVILTPEVDALLAFIRADDKTQVSIDYVSTYFKNLAALVESEISRRDRNGVDAEEQRARVYATLRDAVRADLSIRVLDRKMGEY
jgi:hypothetical protein